MHFLLKSEQQAHTLSFTFSMLKAYFDQLKNDEEDLLRNSSEK